MLVPTTGIAPNGKPYATIEEALEHLIDPALGWGPHGQPLIITYGYRATAPTSPDHGGAPPFERLNEQQFIAAEAAFQAWADVANITFIRVGSGTSGEAAYTDDATILLTGFTDASNAAGFARPPFLAETDSRDSERAAGDAWLNSTLTGDPSASAFYGWKVILHEIGHALGISHAGPYNGEGTSYASSAVYFQDSRMFSVMSYFSGAMTGAALPIYPVLPQILDIAAIQYLYGANMTTRAGDTIYGFNSNSDRAAMTFTSSSVGGAFAIWDAGGEDTIDFSGFSTNSEIDLRELAFSSGGPGLFGAGAAVANVSIARGVTIENAVGGSGDDLLLGNAVANRFTGNAGDDAMDGAGGIDLSIYAANSSTASWLRNPGGAWTVTSVDGVDVLTSVEMLHFTDRDVHLDRASRTFSGDGTSDVLFRGSTGVIVSWDVTGTSLSSAAVLGSAAPSEWTPLATGDLNGDGRDDIVWQHSSSLIYGWRMNGGAMESAVAFSGVGTEWALMGMGDFNRDGVDDMAWRHDSGVVFTWELNASGIASTGYVTGLGLDWTLQGFGDFNSDGRDDFLWRNDDGTTYVWGMDGRTIGSAGATSAQVGDDWTIRGVGDFNRDGRDDILWQDSTGLIASWQMDGATVIGTSYFGSADLSQWEIANIGDYNGDGRDDILFTGDGVVYAWMLGDGVVESSGVIAGVGSEWDVIGD